MGKKIMSRVEGWPNDRKDEVRWVCKIGKKVSMGFGACK